jgi:hypothetical protein
MKIQIHWSSLNFTVNRFFLGERKISADFPTHANESSVAPRQDGSELILDDHLIEVVRHF